MCCDKMMQYMQNIYYGNLSESDALVLNKKQNLAFSCLVDYLDNANVNSNALDNVKRGGQIMKRMRNTKDRDAYMWDIDRKYFSWKVLGTGLSVAEEDMLCQKRDF